MAVRHFELGSRLPGVTREQAWAHVSSWEGVNYELGPWIRMTHPPAYPSVADVPADGRSHFTSCLLALGVLPVDAHRLALHAVEPPAFFDERSSNLLLRSWHHRRTLTEYADGVEVRDACHFEARWAPTGWLVERVYAAVFRRRHRRLRRRFLRPGCTPRPSAGSR